jgi:hypothetical protein
MRGKMQRREVESLANNCLYNIKYKLAMLVKKFPPDAGKVPEIIPVSNGNQGNIKGHIKG